MIHKIQLRSLMFAALSTTIILGFQNCSKPVSFSSDKGLAQGISAVPGLDTTSVNPAAPAANSPALSNSSSTTPNSGSNTSQASEGNPAAKGICILVKDCEGVEHSDEAKCDHEVEDADKMVQNSKSPAKNLKALRVLKFFDGENPQAQDVCVLKATCDDIDSKIKSGKSELLNRSESSQQAPQKLKAAHWLADPDGRCESENEGDNDNDKDKDKDKDNDKVKKSNHDEEVEIEIQSK